MLALGLFLGILSFAGVVRWGLRVLSYCLWVLLLGGLLVGLGDLCLWVVGDDDDWCRLLLWRDLLLCLDCWGDVVEWWGLVCV